MMRLLCHMLIVLLAVMSLAAIASTSPDDPELNRRYHALSDEIRCPVCEGQPISGSNADFAEDMRRQVREMLEAGASDQDIRNYMVERYGDSVLLRPPVDKALALWVLPLLIFAAGGLIVFVTLRRHRPGDEEPHA